MSGATVSIPNNVRKTIENIKEITGNHSEDEIYAMLRDCSMDPNETVQKLILQDVALDIIDMHPGIVLEEDTNGQTALQIMARKPVIYPGGNGLGFWGRFISSYIPIKKSKGATQNKILLTIINMLTSGMWVLLILVAPRYKRIYGIKLNDSLASLFVKRVCEYVIEKGDHDVVWKILGSAIVTAVRYGAYELIEECIVWVAQSEIH